MWFTHDVMRDMNIFRWPRIAFAVILAFFLWFAGDGVNAYFQPDDMMNLYGYWHAPVPELLGQTRPLAAAFYLPLFAWFGFNPLPFRIVCMGLLLGNLCLTFATARRLAGEEIALLATLLAAYHASFADLYWSSATIYDLLCYFFYGAALLYYLRARKAGRNGVVLWSALYVLALSAKEMAVSLPVAVAAYELLYERGRRRWGAPIAGAVVTVAYLAIKLRRFDGNTAYSVGLSLDTFLNTWAHYLNMLFYVDQMVTPAMAALVLTGTLAMAATSRHLALCWVFMVVGALPVIFITPRSLYVMYLPYLGWTVFGATLLVKGSEFLLRKWNWRAPALFAAVACALFPLHAWRKPITMTWVPASAGQVRAIADQFRARYPDMRKGARILFLDDPIPADDWLPYFTLKLLYRDDTLDVPRVKQMAQPPTAEEIARFDHVVRFTDWVLTP